MHRTQGEDFGPNANGVGKRGYIPANPPSNLATRLPAEAMNSIQEEICNVIELTGLNLSSSADVDRATGWVQLYNAIFKTKHIDDDSIKDNSISDIKIISLNFSKLIGDYYKSNGTSANYRTLFIKTPEVGQSNPLQIFLGYSTIPDPTNFNSLLRGTKMDEGSFEVRDNSLQQILINAGGIRSTYNGPQLRNVLVTNPLTEQVTIGGQTYTRYIFTSALSRTNSRVLNLSFTIERSVDSSGIEGSGLTNLDSNIFIQNATNFGNVHSDNSNLVFSYSETGQTQIKIMAFVKGTNAGGYFSNPRVLITAQNI
jgi:hypothetical protein